MSDIETMRLADTQAVFAQAIQQTTPVADQAIASMTPRFVSGNDRLSPTSQLEIYREQFWLRHVDALEEDFITITAALGHDAFHALAAEYLAAHPPTAFSLRDLGAEFAAFVSERAPYAADPFLFDCARLEWAFVDAFDAADAVPVTAEAIAAIPEDGWTDARLRFHPALYTLALSYPAHDYRAAVRRGERPARPEASPVHVAIYRGPDTLQYVEIEPLAFQLLELLRKGTSLGDACEAVAATVSDGTGEAILEAKVGGWFQSWTAYGWVVEIAAQEA